MWTLLETIHLWAVGLVELADGVAVENRDSPCRQWELRRDGLSGDEKRCEWGRGVVNRAGDILGLSTQSLNVPEIPESGLDAVESAPPTPPPETYLSLRSYPASPRLPGSVLGCLSQRTRVGTAPPGICNQNRERC